MSEPVLRLEPDQVSADPGGEVRAVVTVTNLGTVVEGYDLDVVSTSPMPWARVEPPSLSVYPQESASATVVFAPPSGDQAPAGTLPFGVRARSQVTVEDSAVAEGAVWVGAVTGLQAQLTPVASSGRWRGRHTVTVSNFGNAPVRLVLQPQSPEEALGFLLSPAVLDVAPGATVVARMKVRTRHPTLRGTPQRLGFQVVAQPDPPPPYTGQPLTVSTPERPVLDGAFNQKPILTKFTVTAAVLGLILALGLGGLAYANRPEPPPAEQANPSTPTGFKLADATSNAMSFTWDEPTEDVDNYLFYQVKNDARVNPPLTVDGSAQAAVREDLRPNTEYCFVMAARREKLRSEFTDQKCGTTKPPGQGGEQLSLSGPVMSPATDGGETESPTTGNGGETPSSPTDDSRPTDGSKGVENGLPLAFITVVETRLQGVISEADVRARRQEWLDAGVTGVKYLPTSDYELGRVMPGAASDSSPTPMSFAQASWLLYVDGADADSAQRACTDAVAQAQSGGPTPPDACISTYKVLSGATATPTP